MCVWCSKWYWFYSDSSSVSFNWVIGIPSFAIAAIIENEMDDSDVGILYVTIRVRGGDIEVGFVGVDGGAGGTVTGVIGVTADTEPSVCTNDDVAWVKSIMAGRMFTSR